MAGTAGAALRGEQYTRAQEAHIDSVNEEGAEGAVRGNVQAMSELAQALAQAKDKGGLALPLQAAERQRQELASFHSLLELVPAAHGEHRERDGDHRVADVAGCDEEDEDVGFVDQLALPDRLLAFRAWVSAC